MSIVYEPVQIIVDSLAIMGDEAKYDLNSAVTKNYVDSHITTAVSQIIDGAPESLNTLKEISVALNNNPDIAATLINQLAGLNSALNDEITQRADGDSSVQFMISEESSSRVSQCNDLNSYIAAEVEHRERERAEYLGKFDDETKARTDTDAAEGAARMAEDSSIRQYIDAEVNERLTQKEIFLQYRQEDADARDNADNLKFDKAGGVVSGVVELNSYLQFGPSWRVAASLTGDRIVFEFYKNNKWNPALPFICRP